MATLYQKNRFFPPLDANYDTKLASKFLRLDTLVPVKTEIVQDRNGRNLHARPKAARASMSFALKDTLAFSSMIIRARGRLVNPFQDKRRSCLTEIRSAIAR